MSMNEMLQKRIPKVFYTIIRQIDTQHDVVSSNLYRSQLLGGSLCEHIEKKLDRTNGLLGFCCYLSAHRSEMPMRVFIS